MGAFFFRIYEFLFTLSNPPPVTHRAHVPERYTIKFIPAAASPSQSVNSVSHSVSPLISHPFVPAELPARYAIVFVPAISAVDAVPTSVVPCISPSSYSVVSSAKFLFPVSSASAVPVSDDFSVVSSDNLIPAAVFTSSSCIDTTQ